VTLVMLFLLLDGWCWVLVFLSGSVAWGSWWVVVFVAFFSGEREGVGLGIVGLGGRLTGFSFHSWFVFNVSVDLLLPLFVILIDSCFF
jgi:hypothetical protein